MRENIFKNREEVKEFLREYLSEDDDKILTDIENEIYDDGLVEEIDENKCGYYLEFGLDFNSSDHCNDCDVWSDCLERLKELKVKWDKENKVNPHMDQFEDDEGDCPGCPENKMTSYDICSDCNSKHKIKKKNKCPYKHKFGKDCDLQKECEECHVWDECVDKNNDDELKEKKSKCPHGHIWGEDYRVNAYMDHCNNCAIQKECEKG